MKIAALLLTLSCVQASPISNPLTMHETITALDQAYMRWYQAQAVTLQVDLDKLAIIEQTWERWFGRVARLIALAENGPLEDRKAIEIVIENELEQARRWLVTLGVFIKLKDVQLLGDSNIQSANRAFRDSEVCSF